MLKPTIHNNGTSKTELLEQLTKAIHSIYEAIDAVVKAAPNARDYYTQGEGAFSQAREEHRARVTALKNVGEEIESILVHVVDA